MRCLLFFVAALAAVHGAPSRWAHEHPDLHPLSRVRPDKITIAKPQYAKSTLLASPDVVEQGGSFVTVRWTAIFPEPKPYWIGMYLAGEDPLSVVPVKYIFANPEGSYTAKDSGAVTFWVINMRKGVVFNLYRGSPEESALVATSNLVNLRMPNEPTGGRLTHGHNATEMKVSWITGPTAKNQTVQWGPAAGKYTSTAFAVPTTYTRADMCGGQARGVGFRDPGLLWSATITGLNFSQKVSYRYGSDVDGWSFPATFISKPAEDAKVKFFMFGDLGSHSPDDSEQAWDSQASRNTTDRMLAEATGKTMVFHVGDISYAVGYASRWDDFHDQISPIATKMPWMTAIGNHERDWAGSAIPVNDSGGECGVSYDTRFAMPGTDRDIPWYSFDHGPVHFCVISTEHDFDDQYSFVLSDLATVNRTRTPWVIFAGHRPMYVSSINQNPVDGDQTVAQVLRDKFETLLSIAEVDLVVAGHHHSYQRTCPVYKGACVPPVKNTSWTAPINVCVGMAGFASTTNIQDPQPPIFQIVDAEHHGYVRVTADPSTFMMEYVRSDDGNVYDTLTLKKNVTMHSSGNFAHKISQHKLKRGSSEVVVQ